jgi:hypothetical protein
MGLGGAWVERRRDGWEQMMVIAVTEAGIVVAVRALTVFIVPFDG